MKTFVIFCTVAMFVVAIDGQQQQQVSNIDANDIYNQMFKLARHCQTVINKINPVLESHLAADSEVIFDSATPLLKELQLQLISVSCETIIYGSVAGQKATLSEALNSDSENFSKNPVLKNP